MLNNMCVEWEYIWKIQIGTLLLTQAIHAWNMDYSKIKKQDMFQAFSSMHIIILLFNFNPKKGSN